MPNDAGAGSRSPWLGVLVGLVSALVYLPALWTGFNADDFLILWRIKTIATESGPFGYFTFAFYDYFRPLGFLSFALDWWMWPINTFGALGFHLTNVLLHAANTLLVFYLAARLLPRRAASLAALVFGLHPASHEAVYWVAARFDLLATFFTLVSLNGLALRRSGLRIAGYAAFGMALLSKESAVSLLIIAPAWDVLIARLPLREASRRLIPLLVVAAIYAAARTLGADLDAVGGERKLPKLVMTAVAIVGVFWLAWRREQPGQAGRNAVARKLIPLGVIAAVAAVLLPTPWFVEKAGFLAHVAYYSVSPVVFPAVDPGWFSPVSLLAAWPHLMAVAVLVVAGWLWVQNAGDARDNALFIILFVAAALLPVSSMTGGLRYLYLPTAGVALVAAQLIESLRPVRRRLALALLVATLVVSVQQLFHAGRAWKAAAAMTHEGTLLMASSVQRCGMDDVLLLTAPVGIGGVYANVSWDAFDVLAGCTPRSFMTLLRVMKADVHVDLSHPQPNTAELRVPDYSGNIVASSDLRNFGVPIAPGDATAIDTVAGRLETFAEGSTQVFRLTMTEEARVAGRFYYSDGRIRQ